MPLFDTKKNNFFFHKDYNVYIVCFSIIFVSFFGVLEMPRSRTRSRSTSPAVTRRSRSPPSDHDSGGDDAGSIERSNEFRVHIAQLTPGVKDSDVRKVFQQFGTIMDLWLAQASCFAFVVYKRKEEAQAAIDQMDGRSFGNNRLKVTWARPRARNQSHRYDPNMRCYQCGQRGHFSRDCGRMTMDNRSSRRREDYGRYSSSSYGRHSRSRSPLTPPTPPPPSYFRHGPPPVYPPMSRRYDYGMDGYFPPNGSNGREHRYRERAIRLTPPSARAKYTNRS